MEENWRTIYVRKTFYKLVVLVSGKLGVGFWPMSKLCLVIEKANKNKNSVFFLKKNYLFGVDV